MNIQEAIKSGKKFKRPMHTNFMECCKDGRIKYSDAKYTYDIRVDDLLENDWYIEEERRELSWEEIRKIITPFAVKYKGDSGNVYHDLFTFEQRIKTALGFKE